MTSMTFIDLFSGIGGFHQALIKCGCKCVLACDIDKTCRENYTLNYQVEVHPNIKQLKEEELPDFDIICGGFPCQPFSNGGNKKTFDDERGLLFDEIIRIATYKLPRFMFLENVKHILKVGNGEVFNYIKKKIAQIGYQLEWHIMSPHQYGIPQQRERVYFICIRNDIYNHIPVCLPTYNNSTMNFKDYLIDKQDIPEKYFINGDLLHVLHAWDELIKQFDEGEKLSPTILMHDRFITYSDEEFLSLPKWKKDYMIKNKPLLDKYDSVITPWYNKHKTLLNKRQIYAQLEWQVGKLKPNDSIFNYFIQIRQSGIRVKKAQYFPTLVAISQIPIYGKEKRYLTPRECANIQSFPQSYQLAPNDKHSYKHLGNSVNVHNVHTIISSTFKHYNLETN